MFQDYIEEKRQKATKKGVISVPADIAERWQSRVIAGSLHNRGAQGAEQYVNNYGKGIAAPKLIHLALKAEIEGCPEMALGFWRKAYTLETGKAPDVAGATAAAVFIDEAKNIPAKKEYRGALPAHLQPGKLITMQPTDAKYDRDFYINSPIYWGQPKRDGNRMVVIADNGISYQSRSTKLRPEPSIDIHTYLLQALGIFGPFVLDGELFYPDWEGKEHRTGAQAATANIEAGYGSTPVEPVYAIFAALYFKGQDLTNDQYARRVLMGAAIGSELVDWAPRYFEVVDTARDVHAKKVLCTNQQAEGREGEVWFRYDTQYVGGKNNKHETIVRTKYLQEFEAVVTGLTPTTAAGRPFGAIEIKSLDGSSLGAIGTGMTIREMEEITHRFAANRNLKIKVRSQGFTETGQVWHGRFDGFV